MFIHYSLLELFITIKHFTNISKHLFPQEIGEQVKFMKKIDFQLLSNYDTELMTETLVLRLHF